MDLRASTLPSTPEHPPLPADALPISAGEMFKMVAEHTQNAALVTDVDYRILWANASFTRVTGYTLDEARGRKPNEFLRCPESEPAKIAEINAALAAGRSFLVKILNQHKNGSRYWIRLEGQPIRNDGGKLVAFMTIGNDVTEQVDREAALARSEVLLNEAQRIARIGSWEYDLRSGRIRWSPETYRIYDLPASSLPEQALCLALFVDTHRPIIETAFEVCCRMGVPYDLELQLRTATGRLAWVRCIGYADRENGRVVRAAGIIQDVTRERTNELALRASQENLRLTNASLQSTIEETQRLASAAEAANQAKSAFLATISHEIRTPLNGVIGMTNILADTPLTDDQRDYLRTIRLSGETLLTLINDTLDYSKIEAGRVELEQQPFDIVSCVEESIDLLATPALQKGLELVHHVAGDVPRMIKGDATRLRQILVNLLSNAVKFTHHGEVTLEVTLQPPDGSGLVLHFSVRDTGIGIPKDKHSRLFERFSQVDASTTRNYGGTGLGLAISKRLAELMGGTIWAESDAGQGATFFVNIRASAAPDDPATEQRLQVQACLNGRRILLVDDNAACRHTLERQSRQAGMEPVAVASGAEALARLAAGESFHLIVVDVQMPEMNGAAFIEQLQARGLKRCPVLLLSALGDRQSRPGADASIHKPVKASQLYPTMVSLLSAAPAARPLPATEQTLVRLGESMPLEILMAEDNTVNQRVAQLTLQRLGYDPEIVADGAEAIGALQRRDFDVILMDVQMPSMDGLEATRRIRAQPSWQHRPWIIALTAGAFEEDRANALAAGMNDFLGKPLRVEQLKAALARAYQALDTGKVLPT